MSPIVRPAFSGGAADAGFATSISTAMSSDVEQTSTASPVSRFRPRGKTCGSAQIPGDICRRAVATRVAASSTGITPAGGRFATSRSTTRCLTFAMALPVLRRQIAKDLSASGLPRRKVIAAVVQLLEKTLIRVGNDEYARDNNSFGLTTMRNRHVQVSKSTLRFRFRGKGGKSHDIAFNDVRLAGIVRRCQDLPGHELFGYIDDEGKVQDIGSADINEYLREVTGQDFTAKSFRTWAATVLAACAFQEFPEYRSSAHAKRNVNQAIEAVAGVLGNTPAICRKSYIHPAIVDAYTDGSLPRTRQFEKAEGSVVCRRLSKDGDSRACVAASFTTCSSAANRLGQNRLLRGGAQLASAPKAE